MRENILINNFPEDSALRDKIKFLLNFAVLAPSTHNIQPWLFKISDGGCELYLDHGLDLPQADPLGRDAYIALGFCWENLVIAAKYFGLFGEEKLIFGDSDNNQHQLVAVLDINPNGVRQPDLESLVMATNQRSNVRGKFHARVVDSKIINNLRSAVNDFGLEINLVTDKEKINQLAALTQRGMRLAHAQKKFRSEMSHWIISNLSSRCSGMPAYSMNIPTLPSLFAPAVLKMFDCSAVMGKLNRMSVGSSPLIVAISAAENTPTNWFNTGRLAQRMILPAVAAGLKHSIYLASVEMPPLPEEVKKVLSSSYIPQFLFCLGYMNRHPKLTQRHSVDDKLLI